MNLKTGFVIVSAATMLVLSGCMGTNSDSRSETLSSNTEKMKFVNAAVIAPVSKAVAQTPGVLETIDPEIVKSQLQQLGCPRLVRLFDDASKAQQDQSADLPASFKEALTCFGVDANTSPDSVLSKFKNPRELLDCLCGGTGLSDLLYGSGGAISAFTAASSEAAKASFSASASAGTNYSTPAAGAGTYTTPTSNEYSNP